MVILPDEFDRDDEWDADEDGSADSEAALDPLCDTINRWATCASEWTAKDPSLAKTFQWEGLAQFTRLFLRQFLRPRWLQTDAVMAHARLFFPDFSAGEANYWNMRILPEAWGKSQKHYLCWLIADFCAVDPSLDDLVIAAGIEQARGLGCLSYFEKLLVRELGRKPADVKHLKVAAVRMLSDAETNSSATLDQPATYP